jgi:hypothetical protein
MIRKRLVFEHTTGFHNPEIHALLRGLAAFSEKGEDLRLIIETGGIVDVHQRPEKTNRQSLSARRGESRPEALAKSSYPLRRSRVRNRQLPSNQQVFPQLGVPPEHGRSK